MPGPATALLPAIVVEVKFLPDATTVELVTLVESTLDDQALPKRYAYRLAGNGAILWSVAFDTQKHVEVARA